MQDNLDWVKFRDMKSSCFNIYIKMLRHRKGLLSVFLFEIRKLKTVVKEIVVSIIQMPQGLLQGLRVGLFEPDSIRLYFKFSQHLCGIVVVKTLLFFAFVRSIVINPLAKKVIIDKAGLTKTRGKYF